MRDPKLLVLLASGSLVVMTGGVLAPILPDMIQQRQLDEAWAGLLVSMHYLMLALFCPVLGLIADRLDKLKLLVSSLVAYSLLGGAGAFLPTFEGLLLDRGLLGIATSGIAASSLGLLTQRYSGDRRTQAIAYVSVILTLANILYPLLAGAIGTFQWQLAFTLYGLGLPLASCAAVIFKAYPVSDRSHDGNNFFSTDKNATSVGKTLSLGIIFRDFLILRLIVGLSTVSSTIFGMVVYLPLFLQMHFAADAGLNGLVLACMGLGSALSAILALKWLTNKLGIIRIIPLGLGLMGLILVIVPTLQQLNWVILAVFMFGMSFGIVTPSLYNGLAVLTPYALQSSVLATGIGAGFLGQFLSPLIFGQVLALADLTRIFHLAAAISLGTGLLLMFKSSMGAGNSGDV